ncbi:MAG: L-serine ammonia-lyase, iron-sulfur-dependent, subunit alpha [Lachnospiraceae bacterium]|nr:L-serine ammonia-lyase, iron-sulfur-dependent, subunit alpha [Lachnospiraceae bacterium]
MDKSSKEYSDLTKILEEELKTAMGCTEPIAIAYASARCRELLGYIPEKVEVYASGSIIKNVKSVIVPNTGGLYGIEVATAAGIIFGNSSKKLEVISSATKDDIDRLNEYLKRNIIKVMYFKDSCTLDIKVIEYYKDNKAIVRVTNNHTSITHLEKNGEVIMHEDIKDDPNAGLTDRSFMNLTNIYDYVNTCDINDIKDIIKHQIDCNVAISNEGLIHEWGSNIGKVYMMTYGDDVKVRASARAAAGSDARMNGCNMPVVVVSGSGNQGLTASLPVYEYAKDLKVPDERLYRAIVLSDLVTIHIKTDIGRLSAYCGVVCAGAGAGAGIAYLRGSDIEGIGKTIQNALAINSGIVCDGAKSSCAAKIKSSVDAGIMGYDMYLAKKDFKQKDGIIGKNVEDTIKNVGKLGFVGMKETNDEIINIMLSEE